MRIPTQITFRDMPVSDSLESLCWREAEKLARYHDRITTCRVVLTDGLRPNDPTARVSVHVDVMLPGSEIIVSHIPERHRDEDAEAAIRGAFDRVRRHLKDHLGRQCLHRG